MSTVFDRKTSDFGGTRGSGLAAAISEEQVTEPRALTLFVLIRFADKGSPYSAVCVTPPRLDVDFNLLPKHIILWP